MCQALLPRDAPCTDGSLCADRVCRPTDLRCGALAAGTSCLAPGDCALGLDAVNLCIGLTRAADGGIVDAGVCGPRPKHGDPCSSDWAQFTGVACPAGDACLDGQCRTLTPFTGALGSECPTRPYGIVFAPYYGFAYCKNGLTCLPDATARPPQTGRCAMALPLGAECRDTFNCVSLVCGAADGGFQQPYVCLPRAGLNEPCGTCLQELTCIRDLDAGTSTCQPPPANGGNCASFANCANGYCEFPDFTCHPYSSGACAYGYQCESGFCSGGQCAAVGACLASY
jgi:hypothetical protein